ncbi:unnamed protein product [Cunninghamella echinulata]
MLKKSLLDYSEIINISADTTSAGLLKEVAIHNYQPLLHKIHYLDTKFFDKLKWYATILLILSDDGRTTVYANDIRVFLKNEKNYNKMIYYLNNYTRVSNTKFNIHKTGAFSFNSTKDNNWKTLLDTFGSFELSLSFNFLSSSTVPTFSLSHMLLSLPNDYCLLRKNHSIFPTNIFFHISIQSKRFATKTYQTLYTLINYYLDN